MKKLLPVAIAASLTFFPSFSQQPLVEQIERVGSIKVVRQGFLTQLRLGKDPFNVVVEFAGKPEPISNYIQVLYDYYKLTIYADDRYAEISYTTEFGKMTLKPYLPILQRDHPEPPRYGRGPIIIKDNKVAMIPRRGKIHVLEWGKNARLFVNNKTYKIEIEGLGPLRFEDGELLIDFNGRDAKVLYDEEGVTFLFPLGLVVEFK